MPVELWRHKASERGLRDVSHRAVGVDTRVGAPVAIVRRTDPPAPSEIVRAAIAGEFGAAEWVHTLEDVQWRRIAAIELIDALLAADHGGGKDHW